MKPLSDEALERLAAAAAEVEIPGGRYEIQGEVGAGGMGTVYRARDRELERDVAIKVVRETREPHALAERLRREARTVASLEHPSIPPVHEIGELADGRPYYVMRFVAGATLARAEGGPSARLRLFLRLCETVAYAHARGVVHRDLKPENVMLGPLGELYVMDWGIAAALAASEGAEPGLAASSGAAGTPGFMAPEQAAGAGAPVGPRADVFALGGILAFLTSDGATDRRPTADGAVDLGGVPRRLAAIVGRARAADPDERYPSALELAADVAAYLDREPIAAYREGPLERAGRFLAKHQFVVWLLVGYLTLRVAIFAIYGR